MLTCFSVSKDVNTNSQAGLNMGLETYKISFKIFNAFVHV